MTINVSINRAWNHALLLIKKERRLLLCIFPILVVGIILLNYIPILGLTFIIIWAGTVFAYIDMQSKNRKTMASYLSNGGFSDIMLVNSDEYGEVFVLTSSEEFIICKRTDDGSDKVINSYSVKEYTQQRDKNNIYISNIYDNSEIHFTITAEQKRLNREFNRHFAKTVYSKDRMLAYNMGSNANYTFKNM